MSFAYYKNWEPNILRSDENSSKKVCFIFSVSALRIRLHKEMLLL